MNSQPLSVGGVKGAFEAAVKVRLTIAYSASMPPASLPTAPAKIRRLHDLSQYH